MPIQDGVDGADGGHFDRVRQSPQQALADLAGTPVWFLAPGGDDCRFYGLGQLIGVPMRPSRAIAQTLESALLVAAENLIAGLAGNVEFPAQRGHIFALLEPDYETHSLVHYRTFPP
jgi:hypothetical protein